MTSDCGSRIQHGHDGCSASYRLLCVGSFHLTRDLDQEDSHCGVPLITLREPRIDSVAIKLLVTAARSITDKVKQQVDQVPRLSLNVAFIP